jgi:hypothetical protein
MVKIVLLFMVMLLAAPGPVLESHYNDQTWHTMLNDVKMRYRFSVEHNSFVQVPRFGKDVKELDGKEVVLRGFFLPADVTGDMYVLSYVPMQMCFFCTGSGIESVVEIQTILSHRIRFRRLNTDDFVEVRGRLKLNVSNMDHLIYILEDAALVNVYK